MAQRNRGKQSNDNKYFSEKWHAVFKEAVDDLCFLLSRGYASNSSLQIVGNRYKLNKRQRKAMQRICCSEHEIKSRQASELKPTQLKNRMVEIDGFNILILLESALSGAYIFKARDGTCKDISSVHGSYKRVMQTENAILLIGEALKALRVQSAHWYLDQPISNSGRLKTKLMGVSEANEFNWSVELVYAPDKVLAKSKEVVISSDGWILDQAEKWFNLGAYIIDNNIADASIIKV